MGGQPQVRFWRLFCLRRVLVTGTLCVLLGAAMTVSFSWSLAYRRPHHWVGEEAKCIDVGYGVCWQVCREDAPGRVRIGSYWGNFGGSFLNWDKTPQQVAKRLPPWAGHIEQLVRREVAIASADPVAIVYGNVTLEATGWPLRAMVSNYELAPTSPGNPYRVLSHSGIAVTDPGNARPRVLPLEPLWSGFVTATVLFAALLGIVWIARAFRLRRLSRMRAAARSSLPAVSWWRGGPVWPAARS